jgi:hypothetical protein
MRSEKWGVSEDLVRQGAIESFREEEPRFEHELEDYLFAGKKKISIRLWQIGLKNSCPAVRTNSSDRQFL